MAYKMKSYGLEQLASSYTDGVRKLDEWHAEARRIRIRRHFDKIRDAEERRKAENAKIIAWAYERGRRMAAKSEGGAK